MSRYKITTGWTRITIKDIETYYGSPSASIEREVADVTDTRTGGSYASGAERVTVRCAGKKRVKTFIGESRYDNAVRWTDDTLRELGA